MPPTNPWKLSREILGQLQTTVVRPVGTFTPTEMIVLCHGYGAPGEDLVGIAQAMVGEFDKRKRAPILAFPEAPIDLEEYGMPGGRAWWPFNMAKLMELAAKNDFSEMRNEIPPGIDEARTLLVGTINMLVERFSIDANNLTVGGFSQGAMLAVDTVLRGLPMPPKQLIVMSGALICEKLWRASADRLKEMTVVQSHGRYDPILPIQTGRWLNALLKEYSQEVRYHEFDGPHTIPMKSIEMICE